MNKSLVIALLMGLLSQTEAIRLSSDELEVESKAAVQQIHLQVMQKKVAEAKEKSSNTLQKIQVLKQKIGDKTPVESEKLQKKEENMTINIGALSKPDNNVNKIQELEAMEQALSKATEEAHKQRLNLVGQDSLFAQEPVKNLSPALMELKKTQDK